MVGAFDCVVSVVVFVSIAALSWLLTMDDGYEQFDRAALCLVQRETHVCEKIQTSPFSGLYLH